MTANQEVPVDFHLPTKQGQPHDREGEVTPSPGLWRVGSAAGRRSDWIEYRRSVASQTVSARGTAPWLRQVRLTLWIALFSMLGYFLISRYVISVVEVQGRSMVPTLKDGERYFLNRLAFYVRTPARGELVVLRDPGHEDCAVKRIVGCPGDSLLIQDGAVYVNGERLAEPYLAPGTQTLAANRKGARFFLDRDNYFLLGDNRSCSEDSRVYGPVTRREIVGLIPQ